MFCSTCGNELPRENLKYCNRCGARTVFEPGKIESADKSNNLAQTLTIATGWTGFAGLVALAVVIANLLRREFIPYEAVVLVAIFACVVFGVISLLVRQIANLSNFNSPQSSLNQASPAPAPNNELPAVQTAKLESPQSQPISAASVTEHTTRTLENNRQQQ